MNEPLVELRVGADIVRAWVTDRTDETVHPVLTEPEVLRSRQHAVTGGAWVMADQVHGIDVVDVDGTEPWAPTSGRGDVLVTSARDVRLAVWAGDCAPIVLAADDGTLVAAHGGWRGLAAGVVDVAVDHATMRGGNVVTALLGPVIHSCCYEFGPDELGEVAVGLGTSEAELRATTSAGKPALDVPAGVTGALRRRGIELDLSGPCTGCHDRWFSHRVRNDLGRHALVVERVAS